MTERSDHPGATGKNRRPIRVLIPEEDLETVQGHGRYNGVLPDDTDVEGQMYVMTVPHAGDSPDDTEGQGWRGNVQPTDDDTQGQGRINHIRPADDDTEGQGWRSYLVPVTADEVEGQGRWNWLVPDESDASGTTWRLEIDDTEGQGRWSRPPVD